MDINDVSPRRDVIASMGTGPNAIELLAVPPTRFDDIIGIGARKKEGLTSSLVGNNFAQTMKPIVINHPRPSRDVIASMGSGPNTIEILAVPPTNYNDVLTD